MAKSSIRGHSKPFTHAIARQLRRVAFALTIGAASALTCYSSANAAVVSLGLEATFPKSDPFGMAFGDGFIWWQSTDGVVKQMTLAGVDTGVTATNPLGWSALAWDSGLLVSAEGKDVTYFNPVTSAVVKTTTISASAPGPSLIDGLDIGPGGEIWFSPDVGNVYRLTADGTNSIPSNVNPFLGGAGGYSGVERIDITAGTYVFVVNDATNPRQLCIHQLDSTEIGCTPFANQRYEDLAYDGQYLWAADFYGDKIDKFCVQINGGNCLGDPPKPPDEVPGPLPLLGATAVLGSIRRLHELSRRMSSVKA
ncbi:MAG: hypothetical protein RLZZ609_2846 [Cyanobacteriota bacterium]|jgi:hypothetical protein